MRRSTIAGLLATRIEQIEGSLQGILAQLDDLTEEPMLLSDHPDHEATEPDNEEETQTTATPTTAAMATATPTTAMTTTPTDQ